MGNKKYGPFFETLHNMSANNFLKKQYIKFDNNTLL